LWHAVYTDLAGKLIPLLPPWTGNAKVCHARGSGHPGRSRRKQKREELDSRFRGNDRKDMAKRLILIVEDNEKSRKLVRDVLQVKGFHRPITAHNILRLKG